MSDRIIKKDQLAGLVDALKADREVFAPGLVDGKWVWAPVSEGSQVTTDFVNTRMSPKEFFLPQTEVLGRFKNDPSDPQGMIIQPAPDLATLRALICVRPCDAKAMQVLDMIFVQDEMTDDTPWRDKREKTLMVGLACNNPCPTCFCTSVNCGPHHEVGLDVLLVDLGDELLARPVTDKGAQALGDMPQADAAATQKAADLKAKAEAAITTGVKMDNINSREVLEVFEHPVWDSVYQGCLNCGTCTFCCPTCHCFDIQDETKGKEGRRVRNWDYCMSWLFTVHGTGHNPRHGKKERVRQRFMHKFKYIPVKRGGEIGCTGCGRCVQLCPVNIDVRRVVNDLNS